MPPKTRITKDMIVNAAVEVAKQSGYENINARTVAERLHCSTQPVMYHFSTIDAMKRAAYAQEHSLLEMIDSEELIPILAAMQEGTGLSMEQTKQLFLTVALFTHGYASIIANNGLEYDEKLVAEHLEQTWNGALLAAAQEESNERERR